MWRIQTVLELLINTIFSPRPKTKKIMIDRARRDLFLPTQSAEADSHCNVRFSESWESEQREPNRFQIENNKKKQYFIGKKKEVDPGLSQPKQQRPLSSRRGQWLPRILPLPVDRARRRPPGALRRGRSPRARAQETVLARPKKRGRQTIRQDLPRKGCKGRR